ncbi:MAG: 50S ribosomal protein L6 [Candidatus Taylorbacteria bacterium RIFCSPLOWO2_02_FULL_43_11]|uniref:50S ribosomal protein L6 n=1 Tax=Candidatus Taylorbacteria bacterium RIFCSPHIGHO2_02_FULL_43_32b TaxID=1802306 RepID=A0A1G2MHD0_9BACT|nr:MAG: 50S ribosomal protein L6 [Candidatus Taylorbacteria bacterium RIFCSPHIGHO2_01_FULL_43_47]OHA23305.1 MAG: 50S ribosomal protein L6 [Candidatus Taylorbacteria bacterium RIFCSPHIGHO2_02_FULL_43_32b]OHA30173.1 MAG: 50S ribosomal protein L6 [Candidatus Taylorbacteria bacterium RIFCSPLOWO2_01_FULL_43_44]OHA36018.1 MAG: 50S ribosomal protein L6 [Candidatus Taylorbacteria bacterium RIFCSPLOWO2_02_FULL_43_11]
MSRLGKKPIAIPSGTEVKFSGGVLSVKGPLATLTRPVHRNIEPKISANELFVTALQENPESPVLIGTWVSHVNNMIQGVNKPFEKRLLIEGVGYKIDVKGTDVIMSVGFSHQVTLKIPTGIKVVSDKNGVLISGSDIETVGDFAARMRAVKKPEPYKGKGIRYSNEVIRRKQGKKTA